MGKFMARFRKFFQYSIDQGMGFRVDVRLFVGTGKEQRDLLLLWFLIPVAEVFLPDPVMRVLEVLSSNSFPEFLLFFWEPGSEFECLLIQLDSGEAGSQFMEFFSGQGTPLALQPEVKERGSEMW